MVDTSHVLESMMFIHIPKTAGTSIKQQVTTNQTIISRPHPRVPPNFRFAKSGWSSPWHMPPDMYEQMFRKRFNSEGYDQRFCVIRNPVDRYWSDHAWIQGFWNTSLRELSEMYAKDWSAVRWTEEALHRMPQHMFVWSRLGFVQCHCVVPFEYVGNLTSIRTNVARPFRSTTSELPKHFFALYDIDHVLWKRALQDNGYCHRPDPPSHISFRLPSFSFGRGVPAARRE